MDESTFDAQTVQRFPFHRRTIEGGRPDCDLSYLTTATSAEFGRHVWDESGLL